MFHDMLCTKKCFGPLAIKSAQDACPDFTIFHSLHDIFHDMYIPGTGTGTGIGTGIMCSTSIPDLDGNTGHPKRKIDPASPTTACQQVPKPNTRYELIMKPPLARTRVTRYRYLFILPKD